MQLYSKERSSQVKSYRDSRTSGIRIPSNYQGNAFDIDRIQKRTYLPDQKPPKSDEYQEMRYSQSRQYPSYHRFYPVEQQNLSTEYIQDSEEITDGNNSPEIFENGDTSPSEEADEILTPTENSTVKINEETDGKDSLQAFAGILESKHFPFGHGIGYEELLLLGLILFLSNENVGLDSSGLLTDLNITELLLLALLFCG